MRPPVRARSRTSRSRAWSGEIVCRPCWRYQSARAGSITRTIAFSTPKRCWAIWAITRFVLSPAVEAMKTSARSIPAWIRASISSAVPTVNWPLASSQLWRLPGVEALVGERVGVEHRHFMAGGERRLGDGRPDASCADDQYEHCSPAELHSGQIRRSGRPGDSPAARARPAESRAAGAVTITRQSALLITYLVDVADVGLQRAAAAAEARASADQRRFLGAEDDRLDAPACAPRRRSRSPPGGCARSPSRPDTPVYSSPTALARASTWRACLICASGRLASSGSDIGITNTHSASIVASSISASSLLLAGDQERRRLHDVVVEVGPEQRHQHRAVVALAHRLRAQDLRRDGHAAEQRGFVRAAVDDVQQQPREHPADARRSGPVRGRPSPPPSRRPR